MMKTMDETCRREDLIEKAGAAPWDLTIIGGGATGIGCALESALRGYRTLLLEQDDFCKGTSSRSTKLIHGGVRYLEQGNITLVIDALRERGLLLRNAPHLVKALPIVLPLYRNWQIPYYWLGLKAYDLLAGKRRVGRSRFLSRSRLEGTLSTLRRDGLKGGIVFFDGQFDDARLGLALIRQVLAHGGVPLNYVAVSGIQARTDGGFRLQAEDRIGAKLCEFQTRALINAAGIFSDEVRRLDDRAAERKITFSQGSHLVLDRKFLPGDHSILVRTDDGRVLFAIPWLGKVLAGTTDIPVEQPLLEPAPLAEEIEFILAHLRRYLNVSPRPEDIKSVFAGLRPLVYKEGSSRTASLSRDHQVIRSPSGLVSVLGGKWTTYRKMAEDAVDAASKTGGLEIRKSASSSLELADETHCRGDHLDVYGPDRQQIEELIREQPKLGSRLVEELPYLQAEVVWAVRGELAQSVEDILARRTRILLLDARAAIEAAPTVAALMAPQLGKDEEWQRDQVSRFTALAQRYLPVAVEPAEAPISSPVPS